MADQIAVTERELLRLEALFLLWPCSARLPRRISEERARLASLRAAQARALRKEIVLRLAVADMTTLNRVAQDLGVPHAS